MRRRPRQMIRPALGNSAVRRSCESSSSRPMKLCRFVVTASMELILLQIDTMSIYSNDCAFALSRGGMDHQCGAAVRDVAGILGAVDLPGPQSSALRGV